MPDEVTRGELIAYARRQGVRISAHQLVHWHRAGYLPRPRRKHLGRGKGTESLYPAFAADLAVALARALRADRSMERALWRVWASGCPVTRTIREAIRDQLIRELASDVDDVRSILDDIVNERPGNPLDNPPRFPRSRLQVAADFRSTAYQILMDALAGTFDATRYEPTDFADMTVPRWVRERRRKTPQTRSHTVDAIAPELWTAFVSPFDVAKALDAARRVSDAQLENDRNSAIAVLQLIARRLGVPTPPLPYAVFLLAFKLRRVSAHARLLLWRGSRVARDLGYPTLLAFIASLDTAK